MITLAQAKLTMVDDLQKGVIDEFAKSNFLLNNLLFDPVANPIGGGSGWTYSYNRLKTQPTADFREINTKYTDAVVEQEQVSVTLKIFGGSFTIDRRLKNQGGTVGLVTLQMSQKIKAAQALFNDTVINGDIGSNAKAFDGLNALLTGGSTELSPATPIDLSTSAAITTNYQAFLDLLDEFLMGLDGTPSAIMGNTQMIGKLRAIARRAGAYQVTKDSFGYNVEQYNGIPLVDLGAKAGSNSPVVATAAGITSLYVARLGYDGVHAITPAGMPLVEAYFPNFEGTAEEVIRGGVEMVAALAIKSRKSAGVIRNIKVS